MKKPATEPRRGAARPAEPPTDVAGIMSLVEADLSLTILKKTSFLEADLTRVSLREAEFQQTDLRGANLTGWDINEIRRRQGPGPRAAIDNRPWWERLW